MQKQPAKGGLHQLQHFAGLGGIEQKASKGTDEAADNPVLPVLFGEGFGFRVGGLGQFNQLLPGGSRQGRRGETLPQLPKLALHFGQLRILCTLAMESEKDEDWPESL